MSLHNRIIPFSDLNKVVPQRDQFLDAQSKASVDADFKSGKKVLFLPTYLKETHVQDEKYAKAKYKIALMGICKDGRKINVLLDDIYPYFEVKIPFADNDGLIHQRGKPAVTPAEYVNKVRRLLKKSPNTAPYQESVIKGKPFKYYQEKPSRFLRFYYLKSKWRSSAIRLVRDNGYETAHDDLSCYYRVACRDYLTSISTWATLEQYEECHVPVLKGTTYRISIENYHKYDGELTKELMRDKTLTMCWDIETWSKEGNLPEPQNPDDCIFCIGVTFQWANEEQPFLKVALVDYPSNAKPDHLTVVCGTENNIIRGFAQLIEKLSPEFVIGFNDSDYDWPWLINRASQTKGLLTHIAKKMDRCNPWFQQTDESIMKFNYKKEHVKVEADMYVDGWSLMMSGYIPIDVRTVFRGLFPTAEKSSLNWFLQKNNLSSKEDMPYKEMFRIYGEMRDIHDKWVTDYNTRGTQIEFQLDEETPEEIREKYFHLKTRMADINKYCVVDSQRCHDLMKKKAVLGDRREISSLSYCSVYDAFYRANGMKVRNLTISIGQDPSLPFNLRFTNISNQDTEEGKYPGAYVFPPKKGLRVSKLSIDERIEKAKRLLKQKKTNNPLISWLDVIDSRIAEMKAIISKYGAVVTEEGIIAIEQAEGQELEKIFKDFLLERIGRPITGLDFSSLYPSLIMTYNFSPEYCLQTQRKAKEYLRNHPGDRLTKVKFEFNGTTRRAWFIWHNNKLNPASKEEGGDGDEFQFGLYPYILRDLFLKRKITKKLKNKYEHEIEQMREDGSAYLPENAEHFADINFKRNYYNSKQLAQKVFMNTFYGESGNKRSPFFVLELAGGITTYGQKNIKMAQHRVESHKCDVVYGDTDSIYLAIPEKYFEEVDRKYYSGEISKEEYWRSLVEITFKEIKWLRDDVNQMFVADNGTHFLVMAYEEVLYPVIFTAKKKYFGIPHENLVNFNVKSIRDLFIRGLEIKKRGASQILIKSFGSIMMDCCSMTNLKTVMELVLDKIDDIYNSKWELSDFIKSGCYRPNKQNITIRRFYARMTEAGIHCPVNERFEYVIVKRYPFYYDDRGRTVKLKIGDMIEFPDTVKKQNLEIDLDYYMKGQVNGQLARLLVYHDMFHVDPIDNSPEELKNADDRVYKNASKFVNEYCKRYYANYNTFGKVFQKVFRTASKALEKPLKRVDPLAHQLLSANVNLEKFETWFTETIKKRARKDVGTYGDEYVRAALKAVPKERRMEKLELLQRAYYGIPFKSIKDRRTMAYRQRMDILRRRIREGIDDFTKLYTAQHDSIRVLSEVLKQNLHIDKSLYQSTTENKVEFNVSDFEMQFDQDELEQKATELHQKMQNSSYMQVILRKYKDLYYDVYSAMLMQFRTENIVDALKARRNKINQYVARPDEQIMREQAKRDAEENRKSVMDLDI